MLTRYLLLLAAIVALSGCDHWIEKLEPQETGFARHCFDLLQRHDYAAIEDLAGSGLRTGGLSTHLRDMAALIPSGPPISSDTTSVDVSTTNGYTTSSVSMLYQFPSGWLKFDIASEGRGDARTLTWISLQPTAARGAGEEFASFLGAIPLVVFILALIGLVIYRRRAAKREILEATPAELEHRQGWSLALAEIGERMSWPYRVLGIRIVELTSPLSSEECRRRLSRSVANEAFFRFKEPQHSEVQGKVDESKFRIRRRRSTFLSDRYPLFLYGELSTDRGGTRVRCWLGPQRLMLGLAAAFLVLAWMMTLVFEIGRGRFQALSLLSLLGPLMFTGIMAFGFWMNGRTTLKDGPYLLDFLAQTLDTSAKPATKSSSMERVISR